MDNLENLKIDFENWYYKQEQEYATGKVHPKKIWEWFNKSFPLERVVKPTLAETDKIISKLNKDLSNPKFRRQLEKSVEKARKFCEEINKSSKITKEILNQIIDI